MGTVDDGVEVRSMSGGDAPVTVYASDSVITMPPEATLRAVAEELTNDQIGVVVIGSTDEVAGVISERDVVRAVAEFLDPGTTPARDVASTKLVWCDHAATVREAAELMMEQYVRHVLLEDNGRLVGIVSARDLLGAYMFSVE
jgi:CBS domain-containing protein